MKKMLSWMIVLSVFIVPVSTWSETNNYEVESRGTWKKSEGEKSKGEEDKGKKREKSLKEKIREKTEEIFPPAKTKPGFSGAVRG